MKRICVQCGSNAGFEPVFLAMARRLGQTLAERDLELVYGGSQIGLMGAVADATLEAGGRAIGVIPQTLAAKVAHPGLSQLFVVESMHQRKAQMFELADAFLALPGGWGTLEEMAEVLTWAQLGWHTKPCGLLNVASYYDPLLAFLDQAVAKGFLHPAHRTMLLVADEPEALLQQCQAYQAPAVQKWGLVRTELEAGDDGDGGFGAVGATAPPSGGDSGRAGSAAPLGTVRPAGPGGGALL